MRTAMIQCDILSGYLLSPKALDHHACAHPSAICMGHPRCPEALDIRIFIHPSTESALYKSIDTP